MMHPSLKAFPLSWRLMTEPFSVPWASAVGEDLFVSVSFAFSFRLLEPFVSSWPSIGSEPSLWNLCFRLKELCGLALPLGSKRSAVVVPPNMGKLPGE